MSNIENDVGSSEDTFTNCLTGAVNMFSGSEMADRE